MVPGKARERSFVFSLPPVKYHHVGKLPKEGEEPTVYSDEEEAKDESARKND